jgi:hypothetical protein
MRRGCPLPLYLLNCVFQNFLDGFFCKKRAACLQCFHIMSLSPTSHSFKNLFDDFRMKNFTGTKWSNNPHGLLHIYPVATSGSDQLKTVLQ